MHKQRILISMRHQFDIHLIGTQLIVAAFAGCRVIMHADPSVGHDQISALNRLVRIAFDLYI